MASPISYSGNAERHRQTRDEEARRSIRFSRLRLITFLAAATCLVWTLSRGATPLMLLIAVALFVAFGALVVRHARIEDRVAWYEALRLVNVRGAARVARDWNVLPEALPPNDVDLSTHPTAVDLDLFGRASLVQWLGPAATAGGRTTLVGWLLNPAPRADIVARQAAIAELAPLDTWREQFAAHGVLATGATDVEIGRFLAWAEGDGPFGRNAVLVRTMVLTLTGALWLLIALHATGIVSAALWGVPLVAGLVLSYSMTRRIEATLDRAGGGQRALSRYAPLFELTVTISSSSPRLSLLLERLSAEDGPAPASMRRLNRILAFGELRRGAALLHLVIQALTLWDFYVLFALDRWRHTSGRRVREWLESLAEIDGLAQLATLRRDNPEWCVPEITSPPEIEAEALGHPLIPDDRRVVNDVKMGPPGTVLVITGSNMSGKSTLLRAIGLNVVLAQAGGSVCARRLRMPESDLQTSIRVQDSLELGLSYYMAALARLKGVVTAAEHEREGRVLLYLLDEILQGTNSVERSVAVRAIVRHLLDAGAIGAMTTHDLALASEEPLNHAAKLVHFSETLDEQGTMRFDYRLKPGLATSRNALRLMQLIGIDL
jgi:ABC-type multidrug transport system fused ATPase/permease subunit